MGSRAVVRTYLVSPQRKTNHKSPEGKTERRVLALQQDSMSGFDAGCFEHQRNRTLRAGIVQAEESAIIRDSVKWSKPTQCAFASTLWTSQDGNWEICRRRLHDVKEDFWMQDAHGTC